MIKQDYPFWFFVVSFLIICYLCYNIFAPFLMIFLWAAILVSTFYPIYSKLLKWTRHKRTVCSLIMVFTLTVLIILPIVWLILLITRQSIDMYNLVSANLSSPDFHSLDQFLQNPEVLRIKNYLSQNFHLNDVAIKDAVQSVMKYISVFLVEQSQTVFSSVARSFFNFFLLLIATFYFFRNGEEIVANIRKLSPLTAEKEERIIRKFSEVSRATLLGNIVTALVQGLLGGIGFVIIGLPSPLLWGSVMAFLALVPVVGTFLVWIPTAIFIFASGRTGAGIFILIWGTVSAVLSDDLLKPLIIKGKAKMHPLVVFFSILGGLSFFGFSGLILGPLVTAISLVFLEFYREEFREQLPGTIKLSREQVNELLARHETEIPDP